VLESLKLLFVKALKNEDEESLRRALKEAYLQFEVRDESGEWLLLALKEHEHYLLPTSLSYDLLKFLDEIEEGCLENQYLRPFLDQLEENDLPSDIRKVVDPIHLLSFAFAMERLNLLTRANPLLLEEVVRFFQKVRFKRGFYRVSNLLGIIKLHSIQKPVVLFLKAWKKGRMSKNFAKFFLTLNIFEAFLVDLCTGFWANAKATLPLMLFNPNYQGFFGLFKKYHFGAPSRFSEDGNGLLLFSPAQKEWSDLYQVWNMALVVQFPQSVYLLTKLLIPSVSRYSDRPGNYMHQRISALLLAMNFIDMAHHHPRTKVDISQIPPFPKEIIERWGHINELSARDYMRLVRRT